MKYTPTHTKYIVIGAVAICLLILVFTLFRSCRSSELNTHEEVIKAKDETIKAIVEGREAYKLIIDEKDKNILQLQKRDSVLQANYLQNQNAYKILNAKLQDIPAFIARIANNDDSIRAAFHRHATDRQD